MPLVIRMILADSLTSRPFATVVRLFISYRPFAHQGNSGDCGTARAGPLTLRSGSAGKSGVAMHACTLHVALASSRVFGEHSAARMRDRERLRRTRVLRAPQTVFAHMQGPIPWTARYCIDTTIDKTQRNNKANHMLHSPIAGMIYVVALVGARLAMTPFMGLQVRRAPTNVTPQTTPTTTTMHMAN